MERNDGADERSSCTEHEAVVGGCSGETTCEGIRALSTAGQKPGGHGALVKRLSKYGMHILPNSFARRSRLQRRQLEITDSSTAGAPRRFSTDSTERGSLTPAMRKKYLKEFLFTTANVGFGGVLSTDTCTTSSSSREEEQDPQQHTDWVLYPMEHAWMLSAVDGNYEALLDFITDDPSLLTRKDFICGFSVLHWLAKRGESETLDKLLRYAETARTPANVNVKGSGGVTPLHVASMHGQYTVIKLLVGAYGASVDVMDYNGKRAWQYLKGNAPLEMRELLGTWDDAHNTTGAQNANNSAASTTQSTRDEGHDDVDSLDRRNAGTGSWSLKSFRDLFNFLGNKS